MTTWLGTVLWRESGSGGVLGSAVTTGEDFLAGRCAVLQDWVTGLFGQQSGVRLWGGRCGRADGSVLVARTVADVWRQ